MPRLTGTVIHRSGGRPACRRAGHPARRNQARKLRGREILQTSENFERLFRAAGRRPLRQPGGLPLQLRCRRPVCAGHSLIPPPTPSPRQSAERAGERGFEFKNAPPLLAPFLPWGRSGRKKVGVSRACCPNRTGARTAMSARCEPPLKTSKTFAKWIARTQRSALRAFGQHALKMRPFVPGGRDLLAPARHPCVSTAFVLLFNTISR